MALPRNARGPDPVGRQNAEEMDIESDSVSGDTKTRMGLLSQTLIPSPIIQWILPARLRHKRHNDVVFIGERSLQIKEAVSGVHLQAVSSKPDFDAQIMAAKVINVSTELPWEAQMMMDDSSSNSSTNPGSQKDLPSQMLCLSLASRELVFLYYSDASEQYIHYRRPLPNDVSTFERFGRNIAVEPRSRAVAVSASCDYFGVFVLKKPPILQNQMSQSQLDPIAEERFFRVEGDILFMEFLYPRPEDASKIMLLLLIAQDQITHAICYEWDAHSPLRQISPKMTKKLLPFEDRLPTMLIPLTKTSSFMLVTTTSMVVYRNCLDPRRQPVRYPLHVPDRDSRRSPLWTRWARPLRNWQYNQRHDDIYLCREDGQIYYLEIGNDGDVENHTHLGQLCCDVDGAFDILDIGNEGDDLLLAAGNTGDGGLFVQKARDHPRCVQKFLNWTPVTDSVLVDNQDQGLSSTEISSDRLFVCSASSFARGAIVELRHGLEAQSGIAIPLEELSSTRDIWTMPDDSNGGVFVLTSDPVSSMLLHLPSDFGEEICAIDEADVGLDFGTQTLAAGWGSGVVIQVTDRSIRLGSTSETVSSSRLDFEPGRYITAASVDQSASLIIVYATRVQHEMHLNFKRVNISDNSPQLLDICQPLSIQYEPVCISVEVLDAGVFVFLGTGNGRLLVYHIAELVTLVSDITVDVDEEDISKAIDSIAMIRAGQEQSVAKWILLCGLRSGILVSYEVSWDDNMNSSSSIEFKQATPQRLGHTSIKLQGRGNLALLTCGQGFWQVSCLDGRATDYTLQRIWVTDQNNPAYHPKGISSFAMTSIDGVNDTLFCFADGQLLICTLDQNAKTVPRRIDLPGSATKLAYSQHLKSLIVAYTRTAYDTDSDPIKRLSRSYIEFVDPDLQTAVSCPLDSPAEENPQPWRPHGAAGEKISCILEWTPTKGDEQYHFIVLGSARKHQQDRGRVIFLQASRDASSSRIECSVKYIHKFEQPVFAIAPYGGFTLMVSTGREIVPLEPKFSQTRGFRAARYPVLSPAISMTAREPYLYMSMSRESLMVLKADEDKLTLHAYDRQKHDGLSHIYLGGDRKLTLTSSRGGRVSLLTESGVTEQDKMMPVALCEAHLPSSVSQLSIGSKRAHTSSGSAVVYGTTMSGTVYSFSMLNEKEWRLLRLLQNLCMRDALICPFTPKRKRQRNPVGNDSLQFQPTQMHIDGDILSRLLKHGPDQLMHMLITDEFYSHSSPETGSPQAIRERFLELCTEVLGETTNAVEAVMGWLRSILHVGI
ncbi:mono-functional DNA-alkylating methyl methanesulfonate N-term-domain-containing protein [Aspergillus ambiguus]|uniref:protein thtA n=1 Tax=Aspergillus ambiguus TaxID=176160 RepID=UPI003CCE45E0